jgi:glycosyltransferase involved in cell wall biosynthesis
VIIQMNNSLVSVVVPIYNVEKYLVKCIDSILNQTYSNLEIILVNDGSPDDCQKICKKYSGLDRRVKVMHKDNGGLSDARNFGLRYATGQYVIFIDADDYIENKLVENAVQEIKKNNADIIIWGYFVDFVDSDEKLLNTIVRIPRQQVYESSDNNFEISTDLIGFLGYAWNKMYKTQYLKINNMEFEKGLSLVEDIVFNAKVLSNCEKIVFIEEPYVHYIQRPRETLGAKYYPNYFELKKRSLSSVDNILSSWKVNSSEREDIIYNIGFNNIKSAFKMISNSSGSWGEKRNSMKSIREDSIVLDILKNFRPRSVKNLLLYYLIKWKQYKVINTIY